MRSAMMYSIIALSFCDIATWMWPSDLTWKSSSKVFWGLQPMAAKRPAKSIAGVAGRPVRERPMFGALANWWSIRLTVVTRNLTRTWWSFGEVAHRRRVVGCCWVANYFHDSWGPDYFSSLYDSVEQPCWALQSSWWRFGRGIAEARKWI